MKQDFSFITSQKGMFSFAGISPEQVDRLKEKYAIYAVRSGRINVAGMSEATMDRLCSAIAAVLTRPASRVLRAHNTGPRARLARGRLASRKRAVSTRELETRDVPCATRSA